MNIIGEYRNKGNAIVRLNIKIAIDECIVL